MALGLTILAASLAVSAVTTGLQVQQAREAQSEARKNEIRQRQQNELQARRERLQAIAAGRRRRAAAANAIQVSGAGEAGSSAVGGADAVLSQQGAEVGFVNSNTNLVNDIGRSNAAIRNAEFRQSLFQTAGDLSAQVGGSSGDIARLFE